MESQENWLIDLKGNRMIKDYGARKYILERASEFGNAKLTCVLMKIFDMICDNQEDDGCLSDSVALLVVLRSLGYDVKLCYGLCTSPGGLDFYHAWLEMDGKILDMAIYGNAHFSPFWLDDRLIGPYVFENYDDTRIKYYDRKFDEDWDQCLLYTVIRVRSLKAYIDNAPNDCMWKLIFELLGEAYSRSKRKELEKYFVGENF